MATKQTIIPDQVNVITLQCALDWHKAFKDQNIKGFAPGDLPRSIVIPFADIEQIVNDFRTSVKETVNGVRIYFVIKPTAKPNGRPNITGICVPTVGLHAIDPNVIFTDKIVKATLKDGAPRNADCPGGNSGNARSVDEGYVSIYDVTRPCPDMCDPASPLN